MKKQTIIGYLVLDEGHAVRVNPDSEPSWRYFGYVNSRRAVAVFPTKNVASRVKRHLYKKYAAMANKFDPKLDADNKRCFDLWLKRAKSLRISAVVQDVPTVADLREVPR